MGKKEKPIVFWKDGTFEEAIEGCLKEIDSWKAANPKKKICRVGVYIVVGKAKEQRKQWPPRLIPGRPTRKGVRVMHLGKKENEEREKDEVRPDWFPRFKGTEEKE